MAISPTIQREIQRQIEETYKPPPAHAGCNWAADYIRKYGLNIEALATGDEQPAAFRERLEQAYAAYAPSTPGDVALVEQLVASSLEAERCRRLQATLRTEKLRTAELRWIQKQQDEVLKCMSMPNPSESIPRIKKCAAGCRQLLAEWRALAAALAADGTWYQAHCNMAIILQGHSACVEDIYKSETAFWTWLHCLGSRPNPKWGDVELLLDPTVMPKTIQDRGVPVWPTDPAASRAYLEALVARELPEIEALEEELRVNYEEPARAAARDLDQIENSQHEARLLRDLRSHERSVQSAHQALMKRKPRAFCAQALRPA
jgi:hypothetical protein